MHCSIKGERYNINITQLNLYIRWRSCREKPTAQIAHLQAPIDKLTLQLAKELFLSPAQ